MDLVNCMVWTVSVGMLLIAILADAWLGQASALFSKRWVVFLGAVGLLMVFSCRVGVSVLAAIIAAALLYPMLKTRAVRKYRFTDEIGASLASKHTHLSAQDCAEIIEGLRDVFLIAFDEAKTLALPSLAVADAWSALPGNSQNRKCLYDLGPCAVVQPDFVAEGVSSDALSMTWRRCCEHERINEHFPDRLPRLFALDARLAIPGGSRYSIEADNHPPGEPLSPSALIDAIKRRLDPVDTVDARRRAISMLARRIRVSLALERYPHDWSNRDLAELFDALSARNELLAATFGDIAAADAELARAKATPREPDEISCCCAQSVDAVGGARR